MTLDVGIPSFLSWLTVKSVRDLLFLLPTSSRTEITSEHNHAQEFVFLLESFKHLDVTVLRNFYMSTLHPLPILQAHSLVLHPQSFLRFMIYSIIRRNYKHFLY